MYSRTIIFSCWHRCQMESNIRRMHPRFNLQNLLSNSHFFSSKHFHVNMWGEESVQSRWRYHFLANAYIYLKWRCIQLVRSYTQITFGSYNYSRSRYLWSNSQFSCIELETYTNKFNLMFSHWNYYFSCFYGFLSKLFILRSQNLVLA